MSGSLSPKYAILAVAGVAAPYINGLPKFAVPVILLSVAAAVALIKLVRREGALLMAEDTKSKKFQKVIWLLCGSLVVHAVVVKTFQDMREEPNQQPQQQRP